MNLKVYWIVDDDPIARILIEKKMKKKNLGEQVQCFTNGQEALERLQTVHNGDRPDLIFLDLNMPILDGWEFLDAAQSRIQDAKIRVAILSSSISKDDHDKAKKYPCVNCFLNKPLNTDELLSSLNSRS